MIIGESELAQGIVKLRDVVTREERAVPRDKLVEEIRNRLKQVNNNVVVNHIS